MTYSNYLTNQEITEEDYEHVVTLLKTFTIKLWNQLSWFVAETDVLLLAAVF